MLIYIFNMEHWEVCGFCFSVYYDLVLIMMDSEDNAEVVTIQLFFDYEYCFVSTYMGLSLIFGRLGCHFRLAGCARLIYNCVSLCVDLFLIFGWLGCCIWFCVDQLFLDILSVTQFICDLFVLIDARPNGRCSAFSVRPPTRGSANLVKNAPVGFRCGLVVISVGLVMP